ncbi:MAG: class I SAM-dependent methyltransferase [Pseudolabrys sp.]
MNERLNVDPDVAEGFGREWTTFRQGDSELKPGQQQAIFDGYFRIFPWARLPAGSSGMDVGCGSGRWAKLAAPRAGHLHLIDVSPEALAVARGNLAGAGNVSFHAASVSGIPLPDGSQDFAYSLGVLHHVPDTERAITDVARKLKPGAPFLVYLYYAFDNRPRWFRALWSVSNAMRKGIVRLPPTGRLIASQMIAALVYWPLARLALLLDKIGCLPKAMPLAWYRNVSFYVMRTDAYDRFCTTLEKRFTRNEIEAMLMRGGFDNVTFSDSEPYWCAVAFRR